MSTNVEQIKERLNIVDVISSYIKVEKAGVNFKAKCPFHNEKTPSFMISPSRQTFYCFGCGEKGDIFSFVEKFENLEFKAVLKLLAEKAGVELKNTRQEKSEEKDELYEIMEKTCKIYENQLKENKDILKYLHKRGLSDKSILKWRLGFAEDEWRSLYDKLINQGISKEKMIEAGLIKKIDPSTNSQQAKYYDTFRHRIMFPIFDNIGRVIAFSGRAVKEDEKTPKYLNSPETKLFHKSEVLHGLNFAKDSIRKLDYAVLVEGQLDLLMSHQAGVTNTIASSGTALTESHLKKIQRFSNRLIIAYDSDLAGEKASRKAAEMALNLGIEVKIVSLPKGEDPASIAQKNPNHWKKALKESEHFTDFVLNKASKEYRGRNLTREILKNILPIASLIKSEIEKSQFIKKIAQKIGVGEEAVWADLKNLNAKNQDFNIYKKEDKKDLKEELIFEAEKYGLKIDINKISEEISKKTKLKKLKERFQQMASFLDDQRISKEKEKEIKIEIKKLQEQIKELNN